MLNNKFNLVINLFNFQILEKYIVCNLVNSLIKNKSNNFNLNSRLNFD